MKSGEWYCSYDPVLVKIHMIDQNDDNSYKQKQQQQAPVFSHLDKHFIEVGLNKITAYHKWHYQQYNAAGYPNVRRHTG